MATLYLNQDEFVDISELLVKRIQQNVFCGPIPVIKSQMVYVLISNSCLLTMCGDKHSEMLVPSDFHTVYGWKTK